LTRDFAGQKEVDFEILDRSENYLCAVEQIEGKGRRYTKLRNDEVAEPCVENLQNI